MTWQPSLSERRDDFRCGTRPKRTAGKVTEDEAAPSCRVPVWTADGASARVLESEDSAGLQEERRRRGAEAARDPAANVASGFRKLPGAVVAERERSRVDFNGVMLTAAGALEAGDGGVVSRRHRKVRRTLIPRAGPQVW